MTKCLFYVPAGSKPQPGCREMSCLVVWLHPYPPGSKKSDDKPAETNKIKSYLYLRFMYQFAYFTFMYINDNIRSDLKVCVPFWDKSYDKLHGIREFIASKDIIYILISLTIA